MRTAQEKPVFVGLKLEQRLKDSVIFEDERLLVINKPAGIAVHGGSGLSLGVIEALRKMRPDLAYLELVHRLDRETSGCLLLAKKRSVLRAIQALLEAREVTKTYWALLAHPWTGKKMEIVDASLEKIFLNPANGWSLSIRQAKPRKPSSNFLKITPAPVGWRRRQKPEERIKSVSTARTLAILLLVMKNMVKSSTQAM